MTEEERVQELQRQLRQSDIRCVPAGVQSLADDVYPAIQSAYPDLCDDGYRCEEAHDGGKDQPEWKHAVRNVLKQLADDELSRVRRYDDHGSWLFTPRFTPGKQYRRQDLHDRYDGKEQSGISPSRKVPVVFVFTGDTADLYGYEDEFKEDGTLIYTGEGQEGPQTYDHGNRALAKHREDGRELHVFEKDGDGLVTYIGRYVHEEWDWKTLPDKNGEDREAIQFKLRPIEEVAPNSEISLPEGNPNPKRVRDTGIRSQRNRDLVNRMKRLYDDTCQLCGDRRLRGKEIGYSYVHHIKPLAREHNGPDVPGNVIVLCPNHHDDFDNGMLTIDPDTFAITHAYEDTLTGKTVRTKRSHEIDPQFLAYHNQTIAQGFEIDVEANP